MCFFEAKRETFFKNEFFTPPTSCRLLSKTSFVLLFCFCFFIIAREREFARERERERERVSYYREFFSFVFFLCLRTTFLKAVCRLDDVGAFVAFLPRLFFTSLSLSLDVKVTQNKRGSISLFFWSFCVVLFPTRTLKKAQKRRRTLREPVLSNKERGTTNHQSPKTPRTKTLRRLSRRRWHSDTP